MKNVLANIRVVLVNTTHPGNIGAVARAMKTMGLYRLYLCQPRQFPDETADVMASGASDVLRTAIVCQSLDDALANCVFTVGTSARMRRLQWPLLNPRECAKQIVTEAHSHDVALVFGRESSGLTNDELDKCHFLVNIPANPEYCSLNLAAAVQVLCYEIRMCLESLQPIVSEKSEERLATQAEFESYLQHFYKVMQDTGFLNDAHPGSLRRRVRRIFSKARMTATEVNILRGFLSVIKTYSEH